MQHVRGGIFSACKQYPRFYQRQSPLTYTNKPTNCSNRYLPFWIGKPRENHQRPKGTTPVNLWRMDGIDAGKSVVVYFDLLHFWPIRIKSILNITENAGQLKTQVNPSGKMRNLPTRQKQVRYSNIMLRSDPHIAHYIHKGLYTQENVFIYKK